MKKRITIMLSVVFLFMVLCGGLEAATGKDRLVNFAYQGITSSFNVRNNLGTAEAITMAQVYDTLLTKDMDGTFRPNLADSWDISEDGLEYTFHLNKDVKWSDGVDFTAADVEFAFNYLAETPMFSWIYKTNIARMEIVDDDTIKIFVHKPNALFISLLAQPSYGNIMSKHGFEKYGEEYGTAIDKIIGTGAYKVTEWVPNISVTYEAKPDYFKGEAVFKRAKLHRINDHNTASVALQTGELDIYVVPIGGAVYNTLIGNKNIVMGEYISARNEGVYMYCKDGMFADVRMRRAVAHAVNKEDYLAVGMDGLGQIINYPGDIGSAMTANPDFVPAMQYEHDVEKARALVKEAGYEGASIVVKSYNTDPYATLATYIQGVLTEIGLVATVEPMERGTFLAQINAEAVPILPLSWNGQTYDIEEVLGNSLYSQSVGSAGNYSFYIDEEMDRMVEAARGTNDVAKRKELYRAIVDKYIEDMPFVPMFAMKSAIPRRVDITTDNPRSLRLFDYRWAN